MLYDEVYLALVAVPVVGYLVIADNVRLCGYLMENPRGSDPIGGVGSGGVKRRC